jgi:E3 ubiquitin-protein ligase RNF144
MTTGFECPKCRVKFCKECELPEHRGPCDANFQKMFKGWKRCPKCHVFIEKTEGCNHMVCRCNHEFCYVCLANWTEQHYSCR